MDTANYIVMAMLICGLATALVSQRKGRSVLTGFILGAFPGVFGLLIVVLPGPRKATV